MIVHFPDSNCGSRKIKKYFVYKKCLTYYLVVEFFDEAEFYNHKSKNYETKAKVIVNARGLNRFTKFFEKKHTEIYIVSIEDPNTILSIGELAQD